MKKTKILTIVLLAFAWFSFRQKEHHANQNIKAFADGYTSKLSEKVIRKKVTFKNRYGIMLTGDLYIPKDALNKKIAALVVGGPFGAVKEQASGLYANEMAARGFVALAFDPSFTGESGGEPRNMASPDIYTEDMSAGVDFLGLLQDSSWLS